MTPRKTSGETSVIGRWRPPEASASAGPLGRNGVDHDAADAATAYEAALCEDVGQRVAAAAQRHVGQAVRDTDDERSRVRALLQLLADDAPRQLERPGERRPAAQRDSGQ